MNDTGVAVSENGAKDIIFRLCQSPVILNQNEEANRAREVQLSLAADPAAQPTVTPREMNKTSEQSASQLALPFSLFLELLTTTLSDSNKKKEMETVWSQIDTDRDGVLTLKDIQRAAQTFAGPEDDVTNMTVEEIEAMLSELDLDNDGRVTLQDFLHAVDTS